MMKKLFRSVSAALTLALMFGILSAAAESGCILGDVDGNGAVEVADAGWIQRQVASIGIPYTINITSADIDGDGEIALADATLIQRWLADMKSNDNIGKIVGGSTQPTQDEYELPVY